MTFPTAHLAGMLRRVGIDVHHEGTVTKGLVDLPSVDVNSSHGRAGAAGRTKSRTVLVTVQNTALPGVGIGDMLNVGVVAFKVRHVATFADEQVKKMLCEASQDLVVMPGGAVVIPGA